MKAQMFFLESQQDWCEKIPFLLRRHLYENIEVESKAFSNDYPNINKYYQEKEDEFARSYLNLLKASMIKVDEFGINIEDLNGDWWYMGGITEGYKDKPRLKLESKKLASIFPAIAVMDRMVFLPQTINDVFDSPTEFLFFPKPLDMQGVLLVNFRDEKAIQAGIQQVGAQIKTDVIKLCRRYMSVMKILQPDFDDLGKLLNIKKDFLKQIQGEISMSLIRLTPRIVSGPAPRAKRSQVVLEIQNESEDKLGMVRVQVRAPSGTLTAPLVVEYLDFFRGRGQTHSIHFEVDPKPLSRYCPLEVVFNPNEMGQSDDTFPIPLTLEVV